MMSFFEEIDSMKILERNSDKLEGLEMNSARKLLKQYKIAKEELKQKLLFSHDGTFTEAKLKSTLLQVEDQIRALNRKVNPQIKDFFDTMTENGIEDSAREVNALERHFLGVSNPIDIDSIILSTEPQNYLFNQFESSINSYNEGLRNEFQQTLTQSLIMQQPWTQTVWQMESIFDQKDWVLARIVRTELHNIYGNSKLNGFRSVQNSYLPSLKKALYHPMDSRTGTDSEFAASLGLTAELNEPFSYVWKGKKRVFMSPPDRPNDRSILIPYRDEYKLK